MGKASSQLLLAWAGILCVAIVTWVFIFNGHTPWTTRDWLDLDHVIHTRDLFDNNDVKNRVDAYCRTHGTNTTKRQVSILLDRLLVIDSIQTLFCPVPKAGSTSWKSFLSRVTSPQPHARVSAGSQHVSMGSDAKYISEFEHLRRHGIKRLGEYSNDEIRRILREYVKFVVVRDPLSRLVSAYEDKILTDTWYKPHIRPYIIDRYRHGVRKPMGYYIDMYHGTADEGRKYLPSPNQTSAFKVQFTEYLEYVVDTMQKNSSLTPDIHTMTADSLCQPCTVKYDYIGKFETLQADLPNILKLIRLDDVSGQLPMLNSRVSPEKQRGCTRLEQAHSGRNKDNTVICEGEEISYNLLQSIYRSNHRDMDMFGYSQID